MGRSVIADDRLHYVIIGQVGGQCDLRSCQPAATSVWLPEQRGCARCEHIGNTRVVTQADAAELVCTLDLVVVLGEFGFNKKDLHAIQHAMGSMGRQTLATRIWLDGQQTYGGHQTSDVRRFRRLGRLRLCPEFMTILQTTSHDISQPATTCNIVQDEAFCLWHPLACIVKARLA